MCLLLFVIKADIEGQSAQFCGWCISSKLLGSPLYRPGTAASIEDTVTQSTWEGWVWRSSNQFYCFCVSFVTGMISPFAQLINLVLGKLSCLWIWLGPDVSLASYLWEVSLPQLGQQRCWLTASWSGGQGEGQRVGISERLPHGAKQNCFKTAVSAILKTGKQLLFQALIHLYLVTCGWSITHAVLTCRAVDFSSSGALQAGEGRPLLPLTSSLVLWWGMQLEAAETSAEFLLDVCLSPAWVFIVFL